MGKWTHPAAKSNLHSAGYRFAKVWLGNCGHAVPVVLLHVMYFFQLIVVEGWQQINTFFNHLLHRGIVDINSVLDGINSRIHTVMEALASERMA